MGILYIESQLKNSDEVSIFDSKNIVSKNLIKTNCLIKINIIMSNQENKKPRINIKALNEYLASWLRITREGLILSVLFAIL